MHTRGPICWCCQQTSAAVAALISAMLPSARRTQNVFDSQLSSASALGAGAFPFMLDNVSLVR